MPAPTIDDAGRLYAAGDRDGAARACEAILDADPAHFDALHLLGVLRLDAKQLDEALALLERARAAGPSNRQLLSNLGVVHREAKRHAEALAAYRACLDIEPNDVDAHCGAAEALIALEDHAAAAEHARAATRLAPELGIAWYRLARSLEKSGELPEAEVAAREALLRAPDDKEEMAVLVLANALAGQRKYAEALAACERLLARKPGAAEAEWWSSLALLHLGDYAEGWRRYETRWLSEDRDTAPPGYRILEPGRIGGQTVAIHGEQGFGDNIQFARYLPLLAARGARVRVRMARELLPLIRTMPCVEAAVALEDETPVHDQGTALLSLPLAFGTTVETIPSSCPYLSVPVDREAAWRDRLGPRTKPRIGLAWAGTKVNILRSVPDAALLDPILAAVDAEFHCLLRDFRPEDQAWLDRDPVRIHGGAIGDFADAAALIGAMDLTISIDTATAHLAGALGAPVWIVLPYDADWRWFSDRSDSPWYPSARLFRLDRPRDWAPTIARVAAALRDWAAPSV